MFVCRSPQSHICETSVQTKFSNGVVPNIVSTSLSVRLLRVIFRDFQLNINGCAEQYSVLACVNMGNTMDEMGNFVFRDDIIHILAYIFFLFDETYCVIKNECKTSPMSQHASYEDKPLTVPAVVNRSCSYLTQTTQR